MSVAEHYDVRLGGIFSWEVRSFLFSMELWCIRHCSGMCRNIAGDSVKECQEELQEIIRLFINESRRYFDDILDYEAYGNLFCSITRVLAKEKKGLDEDSFSEELQRIVARDYSSNLGKAAVNRAMDWLYSSGIIGFAGKITNCNILDFRAKARCYFMDTGLAFEMPAFATWGNGELDFYTKSLDSGKTYVIELKAGKKSAKSAIEVLEKGTADYLLLAKGATHGGIEDRVYTVPVYGISKFKF